MNRKQAKELLPIIQAFVAGEAIEVRNESKYEPGEWIETTIPSFDIVSHEYRIKPKPKYRPFKDAEECWQEMLKHQPFGWITDNKPQNGAPCNGGQAQLIVCIHDAVVSVAPYFKEKDGNIQQNTATDGNYTYEQALKQFWFMDGTPFGI